LQLLEDLYLFNPDVVAIMITGYAHQATPLDAMRMGVRDYLDKNQDLDREAFLRAVSRQLERIRPAKRQRQLYENLSAFREAVEKVIPLVQSAAALNDPVPLPEAVRSLFQFLLRTTGASDGVLLTRSYDAARQPAEICKVYGSTGAALGVELVPFAKSAAGSVLSLQQPSAMNRLDRLAAEGTLELQPFERGRQSLLAAPMLVAPGIQVVIELFDKKAGPGKGDGGEFTAEDHRLVAAAADFGAELLRQAMAERRTHQVLFDAIAAALQAGDWVAKSLPGSRGVDDSAPATRQRREEPAPAEVMDRLKEGLRATSADGVDARETLRLAEAIRVLAVRHGAPAVEHCIHLIEHLRQLLDAVTGSAPP